MAKTIIEKIWDQHVVHQEEGKPDLLYIDLHLVHEVTPPQAFEGLRLSGRKVRRPDEPGSAVGTADRGTPQELRGVRRPVVGHLRHPPGHRAHH